MSDPFNIEQFANDMCEPWTCCRCQRTFTPTPDDENSFPMGIQTKSVRDPSPNWRGQEFFQQKVGDICADCMRSPKLEAGEKPQ